MGMVITQSEYEDVVDKVTKSIEDMREIRKFDYKAGTYSDRVNLRADKVHRELSQVLDILQGDSED